MEARKASLSRNYNIGWQEWPKNEISHSAIKLIKSQRRRCRAWRRSQGIILFYLFLSCASPLCELLKTMSVKEVANFSRGRGLSDKGGQARRRSESLSAESITSLALEIWSNESRSARSSYTRSGHKKRRPICKTRKTFNQIPLTIDDLLPESKSMRGYSARSLTRHSARIRRPYHPDLLSNVLRTYVQSSLSRSPDCSLALQFVPEAEAQRRKKKSRNEREKFSATSTSQARRLQISFVHLSERTSVLSIAVFFSKK